MLLITNKQTNKIEYAFNNLDPSEVLITREKMLYPTVDSDVNLYTHQLIRAVHDAPNSHLNLYTYTKESGFEVYDKETLDQILLTELNDLQKKLISKLKIIRKSKESSTIEYNGASFSTSIDSRSAMSSSFLIIDENEKIDWKTESGEFVELDKTILREILNKIYKYIQSCFTAEKIIKEKIRSLAYKDLLNIDLDEEWNLIQKV